MACHMGGARERMVASAKRALRVVLGRAVVYEEVLQTAIVEVKVVINSRLSPMSAQNQEI